MRDSEILRAPLKTREEFLGSYAEVGWGGDQTQDKMVGGGEVVKVAGVEEDVVVAEEVDGEGFVGGKIGVVGGGVDGVAEGGVPAGFGME